MIDMYHSLYPASWFLTNQSQKTPFIFTYGDVPVLTLDHMTSLYPSLQQQPIFATPQIAIDIPNMKRIPINMLMQSMESVNNYVPFLRRRNLAQHSLPRQYSKESLLESACGDSGMSSSRSSTPSSVETTMSNESKAQSVTYRNGSSNEKLRPRRNFKHGNTPQRQNMHLNNPQRQNMQQNNPQRQIVYQNNLQRQNVHQNNPQKQNVHQNNPQKQNVHQNNPQRQNVHQNNPQRQSVQNNPQKQKMHLNDHQIQNIHQSPQKQVMQLNDRKNFSVNPKILTSNIPFKNVFHHPNDQWLKVSLAIWNHYVLTRQKDEMYIKKMNLRTAIHQVLSQIFPNCGLRVVGSSVNGLGTNTSDVDMCLILSTTEIDQQTEAMHILRYAQRILHHCSFVKTTDLITAKVPILKVVEKYNNIQVDLNINNTVGIANTQLLGAYSQMDWRVPPLVLVIKKWAQDCKINNAKEMTLSSYSLVLMIIHYFQCGCEPPVLPCLQKLHSHRFESGDYWRLIPFGDEIRFQSKNTESLGSLLYGFFDYFTNKFDFSNDVISVRLGCKLPKAVAMNFRSAKNKRGHWKFICIEEPFNRTNTACAVYDQDSFNRITSAFKSTWLQLKEKKDLACVLTS